MLAGTMVVLRPSCFPRPIAIILNRPLSISPEKSGWALIHPTTTMWSASQAFRSQNTGVPLVLPISTTSMLDAMGHPMAASVMP
jgi:hypothetical protein